MKLALINSEKNLAHELGYVGEWLTENDYDVERMYRPESMNNGSELIPEADVLINMGSLSSAAEGYATDATEAEIAFVREWIASGRPYVGLCFGAQVMARALGGIVERKPRVHRSVEPITWLSQSSPWVRWHEDFITDPGSGTVISETAEAVMILRSGNSWGIQPHIELTPETLVRMSQAIGVSESEYQPLVTDLAAQAGAARAGTFALFDQMLGGKP